uniref:Proteasome subunit beta n=1 Tax=Naja naja TaxID=35670 RepID=A0A8C6VM40_NAJNA
MSLGHGERSGGWGPVVAQGKEGPTPRDHQPTLDLSPLTFENTLGSYGSLARFCNLSWIMKVNDSTILGASGDYADFQHLKQVLEQMVIDEDLLGDGHSYSPKAIHSWLTRVMYNHRSKMNPLWNRVIIGVAYEAPSLATGYGSYLAQPLRREALEKTPSLSQQAARALIEQCMKILYYRDTHLFNRYQITTVTEKGVEVEGPLTLETNWEIAHLVSGFE